MYEAFGEQLREAFMAFFKEHNLSTSTFGWNRR